MSSVTTRRAALLAAATLAAGSGDAIAQDGLIGRFIDPARACFVAIHAADTLAANPDLTVRSIGFGARRGGGPVPDGHDMAGTLSLRLVGQDDRMRSDVLCREDAGHVTCVLPGKGGSFTLHALTNGDLRLTVGEHGLIPDGATHRLPPGAGPDGGFDLIRAGEMMCG
jgi:hypothetical protein